MQSTFIARPSSQTAGYKRGASAWRAPSADFRGADLGTAAVFCQRKDNSLHSHGGASLRSLRREAAGLGSCCLRTLTHPHAKECEALLAHPCATHTPPRAGPRAGIGSRGERGAPPGAGTGCRAQSAYCWCRSAGNTMSAWWRISSVMARALRVTSPKLACALSGAIEGPQKVSMASPRTSLTKSINS